MIYIITFIVSIFFIKIALNFKKNNILFFYIFSVIGILMPCLLAAFRDLSIGTDVNVYIEPLYVLATRTTNFTTYVSLSSEVREILYLLTTFYSAKFFNDIGGVFFVNQLLVILPIYIMLLKISKKDNDIIIGMLLYFFFFYNQTLNMARQSISISLFMLSFDYFRKKDRKWVLLYISACLFHYSAIVGVLIFIFYMLFVSKKMSKKLRDLILIGTAFITFSTVFFLKPIISMLINAGIMGTKAMGYITKYYLDGINVPFIFGTIYIITFFVIYFNHDRLKSILKNNELYDFWFFMIMYSLILLVFNMKFEFADRISYYFYYLTIFNIYPMLSPNSFFKDKKNTIYFNYIFIFALFLFWIFWIVIVGFHDTYPYIFRR